MLKASICLAVALKVVPGQDSVGQKCNILGTRETKLAEEVRPAVEFRLNGYIIVCMPLIFFADALHTVFAAM